MTATLVSLEPRTRFVSVRAWINPDRYKASKNSPIAIYSFI